ncbi:Pleckstrin homology-like domain family B member 1 [Eumeta japonica]|uniref:Pleckstrin homology-like domain family B member 1 n=1 Tax=Eumeta variegata TaxID=151549 RepID=A0A4C1ULJ5_EUMVA|nr:Pleckstrin homology-like domain family B member 1 [Eumeta japonica]
MEESGPTELSFTGRNSTAEAATSARARLVKEIGNAFNIRNQSAPDSIYATRRRVRVRLVTRYGLFCFSGYRTSPLCEPGKGVHVFVHEFMSIYYALAGWSGNRERRDERTKRKRGKRKRHPPPASGRRPARGALGSCAHSALRIRTYTIAYCGSLFPGAEILSSASRVLLPEVATNTPHLVSLGTGRLSTAVTLHPIKQALVPTVSAGRVTIGTDPTCDIHVVGTGVSNLHCRVENSHGVVTLYPINGSTLLDGLPVDKPTRLSQGTIDAAEVETCAPCGHTCAVVA